MEESVTWGNRVWGRGCGGVHTHSDVSLLPPQCIHQPGKLSRTLLLRGFTEVPQQRYDWLKYWPLVITSIPNSFLLPGGQEGRHKSSNPLITLFLWQPALILISILAKPRWWKGAYYEYQNVLLPYISLQKYTGLKALCQELGTDRGCVSSRIAIHKYPLLIWPATVSVADHLADMVVRMSAPMKLRFPPFHPGLFGRTS